MKNKFLFICLAILLCACSSDDDNSNNNSSINPPAWIQGTWLLDGGVANSGYRFDTDDFCTITFNLTNCYKDLVKQINDVGQNATVNQTVTETAYSIKIISANTEIDFEFEKVSDTKIRWTNYPVNSEFIDAPIYIKQ